MSLMRHASRWLALLGLVLPASGLHAASEAKRETAQRLQTVLRSSNFVARAFTKGDRVRLYFTNATGNLMFKADWDRSRLPVHGFTYHPTVLKFDRSPPPLPRPQEKWREIKVLASGEWDRFARVALEKLAPAQTNHAVYFQYALGETLLVRTASGEIKTGPVTALPAGMTVERRLNRDEVATTLAATVEANLLATYPNESAFLLVPPANSQRGHVVLLDLTERRVIMLYGPPGDDADNGVRLGTRLSALTSFAIVDNGYALLKNPVSTAARLFNFGTQWPASLLYPRLSVRKPRVPPLTNAPAMDLAAWERWLDDHSGTKRELGTLRLLVNGEKFFPLFESRIAEASANIDVHVCIFDNDDVGTHIADLLRQRSTNVQVRVIFDHNSTRASGRSTPGTPMPPGFVPPKSIRSCLQTGAPVEVRPFLNPFLSSDHSKVYLIDQRYAYLGGMNLGREYRYEWHDMMAEIEGPIVASIQREFDKNWAHAGPFGDLAFAERALSPKHPGPTNRANFIEIRRVYSKTARHQIRRAELAAIKRAQNHVFLQNPYLYDNSVITALAQARSRGVDVRVVLPTANDFSGGKRSNLVTANYLLRHGVRVYFYPGMTHVKALLADGWACFGSANFNTLSLRLNQESNLATSDPGFAAQLRRDLFETDFGKSFELKEAISVGWSDHLADSILNQF
jgi:cardiolipin synthase A/B